VLGEHRAAGIEVLVHGDPGYPNVLLHDPAPPAVLFALGRTELLGAPAVAIVGTRNATHVGCRTAATLAGELADLGIQVVSGLALGIDGAAHRGVIARLDAPTPAPGLGRPVGVVACGLDLAYPSRHRALHREVEVHGLLLSEHPMGTPPAPWRFPARNRIIAALGLALVVVESRATGGSMLTVGEALARDRPILAVPGHPSSPSAAGTLDLLSEGAIVLRDVDDVLVAIGRAGQRRAAEEGTGAAAPDGRVPEHPMAGAILQLLTGTPRSLEELVAATERPVLEVARAVDELERLGRVVRSGAWLEAAVPGGRRG
jgi:DNA processing protein